MTIVEILNQIDLCDEAYYNQDKSLISDEEYDLLKDKVKEYKTEDKDIAKRIKETLSRVGFVVPDNSSWQKVNHEVAMLSLNKAKNPEEFENWLNVVQSSYFLVTEKLDGLSISLKYENGKLVQALTRGKGDAGFNIYNNVIKMKGIVKEIPDFDGHIRGEIVLMHSDSKHFPDISNVRNAASGICKRLDGEGCEHLSVICYKIEGMQEIKKESEMFLALNRFGFIVPPFTVCSSIEQVVEIWNYYMKTIRANLDYDIDGLVVSVNDISTQLFLGILNGRPKGSIAFKFVSPKATTIVTDIICQVGDTGQITPVAIFNEVNLIGSKIERASLHNFSNVKELGIDIGSEIVITRSNDVIPFITCVTKSTGTIFKAPDKCPVCGSDVVYKGEYVVCPNKYTCSSQIIGRLNKWIGELGILEWGEKVLQKMLDAGIIKDVADIYRLKVEDIVKLDRMGEKSAENLITELDKFREISLEHFIGGLCIENVATSTVKLIIAAGYDSLESIQKLSINQLENISGFGSIRAKAFYNGMIENKSRMDNILAAGVKIKGKAKGTLTGKSFCLTGSMSMPRAKIQKMIEDAGGDIKKSVVKGLSYLVSNEDSSSNKSQAAKKLNIQVITEPQLMDMLN